MSAIRTNAAATMLGVSPNTLRSWEPRFGYPVPHRTDGGHRQFELSHIEALRTALAQTQDIATAVAMARQRGSGPPTDAGMRAAFGEFCAEKADLVLEESLSMRSLERTVETVLLTAVEALSPGAPRTPTNECERLLAGHMSATEGISPEYCFAWRYATGWLAAAHRVAPPAARPEGILILDATSALSMDALHVQALELFLRRASLRVLALPVELQPTRLTTALRALSPTAIVLGGAPDSLDVFGRLVYIARQSLGDVEVLDYRGAVPDTGASTIGRLGDTPGQAVERLGATLASIAANTATSRSGRFVRAERAAGLAGPSDRAAVPSGDGVTVAG